MENGQLPVHVGIIMDGNGRWAQKRLMPRSAGHRAGMNRMIGLAEHAQKRGIRYLTLYVLSTENLDRPKEELEGLYRLIRKYFTENLKRLFEKNAAVKIIGDLSALPQDVAALLRDGEKNSPSDAPFCLTFAVNYGGRAEIVAAANRAVKEGKELSEKQFSSLLYTHGLPDPDLIIRTGGEIRLSNFLLYQAAYTELYFTKKFFPDFSDGDFDLALEDYAKRDKKFGKV